MSGILTAPTPVSAGPHRNDSALAAATAPRTPPSVRTETARAPQPADGAARGLDIRFEDRQGRPVGPPPSFRVSLLQAMQDAALDPRPAQAAAGFAEDATPFAAPDRVDRKV